jgi:hypothetical protein
MHRWELTGRRLIMTAALLAVVGAGQAQAQAPERRWLLGLDAVSGTIDDNELTEDIVINQKANGLGLQLGYLLKPWFMLRVSAIAVDHETSDPDVTIRLGGGTLDAMFLFRAGKPFRPCLFAGLGAYRAESQQAALVYDIHGPGVAFGAGAHLRLGDCATLHGALRVESVNWEKAGATWAQPGGAIEVAAPIDEDGWASKVMLGVGIWL